MHRRMIGSHGVLSITTALLLSACIAPKYTEGDPFGTGGSTAKGTGGSNAGVGAGATSRGGNGIGSSTATSGNGGTNLGGAGNTANHGGTVALGGSSTSDSGGAGGSTAATLGGTSAGGSSTGGGVGMGGVTSGGSPATGGVATGGASSRGGTAGTATGGVATGGVATNTGGAKATGGVTANVGGLPATGGAATGGLPATGGAATGGLPATGGAATGGSGSGSCPRPIGSCTAPTVTVTDVNLGIPVTGYGSEGDTEVFPMAIASVPSGGSRLAWMGTDSKVYVAQLDCGDKLVGIPFSFPAVDLQDIIADDNGGVVLLTRDATNGGADNCGTGTLCGGTSSPCRTMWMVRFNNSGSVEWETQVTNLTSTLGGYQAGARFIWWYQHHGRLAFSGTNYAAIFGVAITVNNGTCVDIHEADSLQVVSSTGALVSSGSLALGMSHAWTSRILWDARTSKFMATDATDNNCRIAIPAGAITVVAGDCAAMLFNGDIVNSVGAGYWNAWSQAGTIRLEHFTTGASDTTIPGAGSSQHPHLVSYGTNHMLLAWQSGTGVAAQVRSASDGAPVGSPLSIAVSDHDYGAWKAYADGSVAYPAAGANTTSVKIARLLPCN